MGHPGRRAAAERSAMAREAMRACRLCVYACGADRTRGPAGVCRCDAVARVFHEGVEWAGEEGLVPTYTVSFSGCNLHCSFCLTGRDSQNGNRGTPLDAASVRARIRANADALRSVTVLGGEPSIHLEGALRVIAGIPERLQVVWKTNAYASPEALALLDGAVDVVLADYKFGNDACAERLGGVPGYTRAVRDNLAWARDRSRLIVRHLLMPGHLDCCFRPAAEWMARALPGIPLSLMGGFLPVFQSARHPELARNILPAEEREARRRAGDLGIRLVPWTAVAGNSTVEPCADELRVDRSGRILVDSGSAKLMACLKGLSGEFRIASTGA